MRIVAASSDASSTLVTRGLAERIVSPMCGVSGSVRFLARSQSEPRVIVATTDLAGFDLLDGGVPSSVVHHIAGMSTSYEVAMRAVLAETVERYAHHGTEFCGRPAVLFASHHTMREHSRPLVPSDLRWFAPHQFAQPNFPFSQLTGATHVGWVGARSLVDGSLGWLPAQIALVGYRRRSSEPRFMSGVSTGTAAHTRPDSAVESAILELIQTDAAMGTWYGEEPPVRVSLGGSARTSAVEELLSRTLPRRAPVPRFYWLPSPDLPGLTTACVIATEATPRVAVGLGCAWTLERSLWKAFLEAAGVVKLATYAVLAHRAGGRPRQAEPDEYYDLDSNVIRYAERPSDVFEQRFPEGPAVDARHLPDDVSDEDPAGRLQRLVAAFRGSGKELVCLDLTTPDVRDLGLTVVRAWSPNILALSLPSAPPLLHPRFAAYGGVRGDAPHPFP